MATPNDKLAESLQVLQELQAGVKLSLSAQNIPKALKTDCVEDFFVLMDVKIDQISISKRANLRTAL